MNTLPHAGGQLKLAYELCMAPEEEDSGPDAMSKFALLTNSALGSTHWLTLSSDQVNIAHLVHTEQRRQASRSGFKVHLQMELQHGIESQSAYWRNSTDCCVIRNSVNVAVLAGGRACSHRSLRRRCRGAGRLWRS